MKQIQSKILLSLLLFATHKTNAMLFPSQADMDAAAKDDDIKSATNSNASLTSAPSRDRLAESDGTSAPASHLRPVSPVDGVAGGGSYVPPLRSITPNQAITPTDDGIKSATNSTASLTSAPSGDRLAESDGSSAPASHLRPVSPVNGVAAGSSYVPPRSTTPNPAIAPTTPATSAPARTSSSLAHQTIGADDAVTAVISTGDTAAPASISAPASSSSSASATSVAPTSNSTISNLRAATADLPEMKDSTGVADDAPYDHTPAPTGNPAASIAATSDAPPSLPPVPARSDTPALPTVNVKYPEFFNLMDQPEFVVVQDPLALITYVDKLKSIVVQTAHDTRGTGKASEVTDIADVKNVYAWANKFYDTAASASPVGRCTIIPKAQFEKIIGKLKNLVERYAQEGIALQVDISLNDPNLKNVIFDDGLAFFDSGTDTLPAQPASAGDETPALPAAPSPIGEDDDGDAAPALPTSPSPAHVERQDPQPCEYLPAAFVKELATCAREVHDAVKKTGKASNDFDDSGKIFIWVEELNTSVERNTGTKIVIPSHSLQQILKRLKTLAQRYSPASFSDDSFATEPLQYDPTKSTQMHVFNQHINFGSEKSDSDSSTESYTGSDDKSIDATTDIGTASSAAISSDATTAPAQTKKEDCYVRLCNTSEVLEYALKVKNETDTWFNDVSHAQDNTDAKDIEAVCIWLNAVNTRSQIGEKPLMSQSTFNKVIARLRQIAGAHSKNDDVLIPIVSTHLFEDTKNIPIFEQPVPFVEAATLAVPSTVASATRTLTMDDGSGTVAQDNALSMPAETNYAFVIADGNSAHCAEAQLVAYAQDVLDGIGLFIRHGEMFGLRESAKDTREKLDAQAILTWAKEYEKLSKEHSFMMVSKETLDKVLARLHVLAELYGRKVVLLESATNYTNPKGMGARIGSSLSDIDFIPEVAPQSAAGADEIPSLADTVWDDPLDEATGNKSNDGKLPPAADTRDTDSHEKRDFDATGYRAIEDKDALLQYTQAIKDGINTRIAEMSDAEVELTKEALERDYLDATAIIEWIYALQKSPATVIAATTINPIIKRLHDLARIYTKKNRTVRSVTAPGSALIFEKEIKLSAPLEESGSESGETGSSSNDDDDGSTSGSASPESDDAESVSGDDADDFDADDDGGSKSDDGSSDRSKSENDDDDDAESTSDAGSSSRSKSADIVNRTNLPTQKTKCVLVESGNTAELQKYVKTIRVAIGNKLEETDYPTSSPELDRDQSAWNDICEIENWAVSLAQKSRGCHAVVPDALMKKVLKKLESLAPQYRIAHLVDDIFIARSGDYAILQADEGDGHPTVIFCREVTLPSEKTTNPSAHGSMSDVSTSDDDDDDENLSVHSDDDTGNKPKAPRDPITPKKPVVTQSSLTGKMLNIVTNKFVITGGVVAAVAWYYYYYMADTRAELDADQPETAKTTIKQTNPKPVAA